MQAIGELLLGKPGTHPRLKIAAAIGSHSSHRFTDGGREIFFGGGAPAVWLGMNPAGIWRGRLPYSSLLAARSRKGRHLFGRHRLE
jgi:hypothetical protein